MTVVSERSGGAATRVAYFSMEVALENQISTYSGGLGVLAGDTLRSAADLGLPMVGVTLLHRKGHFFQRLDTAGRQHEESVTWPVERLLKPLDGACVVEGRPRVRASAAADAASSTRSLVAPDGCGLPRRARAVARRAMRGWRRTLAARPARRA